jgi:hypothetical protein
VRRRLRSTFPDAVRSRTAIRSAGRWLPCAFPHPCPCGVMSASAPANGRMRPAPARPCRCVDRDDTPVSKGRVSSSAHSTAMKRSLSLCCRRDATGIPRCAPPGLRRAPGSPRWVTRNRTAARRLAAPMRIFAAVERNGALRDGFMRRVAFAGHQQGIGLFAAFGISVTSAWPRCWQCAGPGRCRSAARCGCGCR